MEEEKRSPEASPRCVSRALPPRGLQIPKEGAREARW
jgi:hypothetical protein